VRGIYWPSEQLSSPLELLYCTKLVTGWDLAFSKIKSRRRGGSVNIVSTLKSGRSRNRNYDSRQIARHFLPLHSFHTERWAPTDLSMHWLPRAFSPWVKQPGPEPKFSPLFRTEVTLCLHGVMLNYTKSLIEWFQRKGQYFGVWYIGHYKKVSYENVSNSDWLSR
jgi:hypothetical protein